jgi:hypothetical protein
MATRIRVRKGDTEVEYEGSEQFLRTELSSLLQVVSAFPSGSASPAPPAAAGARPEESPGGKSSGRKASDKKSASRKSPGRKSSGRKTPAAPSSANAAADGTTSTDQETRAAPADTTAAIAGKIECKHGTDLVLAASARLNLFAEQKSYSRAALLGEMKTATEYYRPVYGKNLSRYLKNLIKDRQLNEPRPGIYALTAAARREIRKILAE